MALGKINSLGLGSSVLNNDVIDKLRKADEGNIIAPVEKKQKLNIEKQKELVEIKNLIEKLNVQVKGLSDYSAYIKRNVSSSSKAVDAKADPGVPTQDAKIEVKELAKSDINEVGTKFASRDDIFTKEDGTLDFYSHGQNYQIKLKKGMTLNDMAQSITDATEGKVIGVVMKTGGSKPYQLMINSKDTGEDNRVYFGSIVKSEALSDAPLSLEGAKDFYIDVHDKNGNVQRIAITMNLQDKMSLQDKAEAIKNAIKDELEKNESTKELLDNGDINIGLDKEGKALLLNDRRGLKIKVGGEKAKELGFSDHNADSKSGDSQETSMNAKAGKMKGIINIGSESIDLNALTKKNNTAEDNAKAIADAIKKIPGIEVKNDKDKITLSKKEDETKDDDKKTDSKKTQSQDDKTKQNDLKITAKDKDGEEALKALSPKSGEMSDYTRLQKDLFRFKNVQTASDAEITFNGANVRRSTNQIDDMINGLHLTLVNKTEDGQPANISVTNNTEDIVKGIKEFVKAYNELVPVLDGSTKYDAETKKGGVFNMESSIRMIRPRINEAFLSSIGDGFKTKSLVNYGLTIDDKSRMTLDEAKLSSMIASNAEDTKNLFYGQEKKNSSGQFDHIDGVFTKLKGVLADLVTGENAKLTEFEHKLEKEMQDYEKDKEKSKKMLDARYETMTNRFAAYDEQIAKANNSFNAVQMMIDQANGNGGSSKKK